LEKTARNRNESRINFNNQITSADDISQSAMGERKLAGEEGLKLLEQRNPSSNGCPGYPLCTNGREEIDAF